jgi:hypothetical protein
MIYLNILVIKMGFSSAIFAEGYYERVCNLSRHRSKGSVQKVFKILIISLYLNPASRPIN